jgi:hypothetical protein
MLVQVLLMQKNAKTLSAERYFRERCAFKDAALCAAQRANASLQQEV